MEAILKKTLDQKIAFEERKIALLMEKKRARDERIARIIGDAVIANARASSSAGMKLIEFAKSHVKGKADLRAIEPLLNDLSQLQNGDPAQDRER